ncbi:hypothetical protein GMOD_00008658 [Pyrenophora seminiperda CCB06]|uniref:Amino acid permease n=1 Tax=Pyrenophora seminiperda CCB06 TaxID=1302712 RepID=A0A3M7M910_9PLEO|nr:hypothetical protein GMOD_00008658 [Pyrenophora seminiperda CCB06]
MYAQGQKPRRPGQTASATRSRPLIRLDGFPAWMSGDPKRLATAIIPAQPWQSCFVQTSSILLKAVLNRQIRPFVLFCFWRSDPFFCHSLVACTAPRPCKEMAIFTDSKPRVSVEEYDVGSSSSSQDAERMQVGALGGIGHDASDMHRMGKRQELRRNFGLVSMMGFVVVLQLLCLVTGPLVTDAAVRYTYYGLYNGGPAGVVCMMIITWLFVMAIVASLAEMASMAPTAGGQYHWVSEFAPPSLQKALSYVVGCASAIGWITAIPACAQMLSSLVIGMVLQTHPDLYSTIGELWHTTILMILFLFLMVGFNMFLTKHLPLVEIVMLVLHVLVFFAFMIIFWTMAERQPASRVFTTWTNYGGWSSKGLSALVGLSTPLWCFIGPDGGAHMAEEVRDASSVLPKAMVWGVFFNGILGCIMMITFMVCGGASDSVVTSMTGQPVLQAIYNATGSIAGTEAMGALLVILVFFAAVSVTAASSRQIWSFARDGGLPFSRWIEHVPAGRDTSVNALLVCLGLSLAITCINFGSDVTLQAIISVSNVALIFSYIVSIGCVRLKRFRGEPLLARRWSLGKFGGVVNDLALVFLFISFLFSFFPMLPNPTAIDMNWASVMFGAVVIIATVNYFITDIIFPHLSNTPTLSSTLSSLRRSTLSTHNRLCSIISDSKFVTTVASAYALPLVANERCGSWYIPPAEKCGSVYFKSTDGHMGEWSFSLRRLNLQLLDVVEKWGGAVVVDSTRRGKSMPDALSKTVPIWCCVINRAVFGGERGEGEEEMGLFTPPQAVGESEHAQMEGRIDGFVKQFLEICTPNIPHLRRKLTKPLRPIWITQNSPLPQSPAPPSFPDLHPIVLCTASRRVHGAEASERGYIQGAADDHEAWSHGLTPPLFWENTERLLTTGEEDMQALIEDLIASSREEEVNDKTTTTATLITPTTNLYIAPCTSTSAQTMDLTPYATVIAATPTSPFPPSQLKAQAVKKYLHLPCRLGKLGSRDLRGQLPRLLPFFSSSTSTQSPAETNTKNKILITCPTGTDLSVGVALFLLCLYANDAGVLDTSTEPSWAAVVGKGKAMVKQRLSWITMGNADCNPSRATLQSVNAVVLGGGG